MNFVKGLPLSVMSILLLIGCNQSEVPPLTNGLSDDLSNDVTTDYGASSNQTLATPRADTEVKGAVAAKVQQTTQISYKTDKRLDPYIIAQAESFRNIYSSTCGKSLGNLDQLRQKLASLQPLSEQQAQLFLKGANGVAYPVPDDYGTFVLALFDDKPMCAVFARELNGKLAQQQFKEMFATAPAPLVSRQMDLALQNDGQVTTAYTWSIPEADNEMLFVLSTSTDEKSQIQGLFTATLSKKN